MRASLGDQRMRRLTAVVLAGAALLAALLLIRGGGPVGVAVAGDPIPVGPDHFQCYKASFNPNVATGAEITLTDQFFTGGKDHEVGTPKFFCNPVKKVHGDETFEIQNENNHLTAYKLNGKVPKRRLHVINQFQDAVPFDPPNLVTDPGRKRPKHPLILVPTLKVGHGPPANLDHFKCYPAKKIDRSEVNASVQLSDQFIASRGAAVLRAKLICNPADKVHGDNSFDAENLELHYVCYKTSSGTVPPTTRQISNQFGTHAIGPTEANMLCAPSQKFELID